MSELRTPRLTLRPVLASDLEAVIALGSDARVMKGLGGSLSRSESGAWLERQLEHWQRHGYGRYVVARASAFVGLVGLSRLDLDRGLVSGVEVAWRLAFDEWGHGYATESARAVIADGFSRIGLSEVIAVTSSNNARSRRVMARLGMLQAPHETFEHPLLAADDPGRTHVVYRLAATRHDWR